MITHFSVKNYKCLADVSLPLTKLHVIIGQNDTGKTSLFEAIQTLGRASIHSGSRTDARSVLQLPDKKVSGGLDYQSAGQNLPIKISASTNTTTYDFEFKEAVGPTGKPILDIHCYNFNPSVLKFGTAVSSSPSFKLGFDGFGLATYLDTLTKYSTRAFVALADKFRQYFPQYFDVRLKPIQHAIFPSYGHHVQNPPPGVDIILQTQNGELHIQSASDGAVILLAFLALTYSPKPPDVLLIEEPENGIHPKRLIEVAMLLREFTEREQNAPQIILTTHSPLLLSEFQPDEVTLMRRMPDGSAKAFPLRDAKHIHERMQDKSQLGELWYYLSEDELLL